MLNQTVIVGRLTKDPEIREVEGGKKVANMTLAVQRNYKNAEGEYDTDFINCTMWAGVAENTCEFVRKGDVVGVKGRLQTGSYEKDGEKHYTQDLIAEKVSFLSSKRKDEEREEKETKNIAKAKKADKELVA